MIEKAMIMAAGVGSRLEPLSSIVPKPLVPLANTPAMDIIINHLKSFGIKNIIANTYHKAQQIKDHYYNYSQDVEIQFIQEKELSGTAGGLKKCQFFFEKGNDFIVMSGDGLSDVDIEAAYNSHKKSNSIATIITKEVPHEEISKYGIIVTGEDGYVKSFQEKPLLSEAKSNLANTGIYIFNYDIFNYIPENMFFDFAKDVFPYLMHSGININTYIHYGYWSDIGSLEQYKQSNIDIMNKKVKSYTPETYKSGNGIYICGKNSKIENSVNLNGCNVIGNNCQIGINCNIKNSIIWDNVKIEDNITIENSIILSNNTISTSIYNEIKSDTEVVV